MGSEMCIRDSAKTAPRCLKIPPRWPKRPPRRAKRAPRGPKTPPGGRKYFQNGQGYLRYVAFLNPPEIPINWRGGTKAQPSSIRRRSAERRARRRLQSSGLNPSCHPSSYFKLAYLPSSWQLDGLSTPSLILPLDFGILYGAPLGIIPRAS